MVFKILFHLFNHTPYWNYNCSGISKLCALYHNFCRFHSVRHCPNHPKLVHTGLLYEGEDRSRNGSSILYDSIRDFISQIR